MADEKKSGPSTGTDWVDGAIILFVIIAILYYLPDIFEAIKDRFAFGGVEYADGSSFSFRDITSLFASVWGSVMGFVKGVLALLLFVSIVGIIFVSMKFIELRKSRIAQAINITPDKSDDKAQKRWDRIVMLSESLNSAERKLAIIEADNILEEMVNRMGYSGDTLGEKLKNIEISDFNTLEDAWEAHKFRNKIAHQNEEVTKRDVKRVINLYEKIFREFEYI